MHLYFKTNKIIVNRGIGGDTSEYLLKRFIADCIQLEPKKVLLMIGTNDISRTNEDLWWRKRGEDENIVMEDYKNNILEMIKLCDDYNIEILLCSVLPSDIASPYYKEKRWSMTKEMNNFLQSLGKTYVDYHSPLTKDGKSLMYELSPDGIHPNAKAYAIMANTLKEKRTGVEAIL